MPLADRTPHDEPAAVRLLTPDTHYLPGEAISVFLYPPSAATFEVRIVDAHKEEHLHCRTAGSPIRLRAGLPTGHHTVRCRWSAEAEAGDQGPWSGWSFPFVIYVHELEAADEVERLRRFDHALSLICDRDLRGIVTITDPWALPPNCPRQEPVEWFRTPVFEGATTLLNECPDYYRDPLAFFLRAVDTLIERGVRFVTWHDLLDGRLSDAPTAALLQFDVDGGPHSMARLIPPLLERDVRASLMIHREAHDWYEQRLEDFPLDLYRAAEAAGWTVGYHHNAIGNTQRPDRFGDYGPDILAAAAERFRDDVAALRAHFTIRTCTAHGGNVHNHRLTVPDGLDVVSVDRINAPLWTRIRSMFSDGGFLARPCPLLEKVAALPEGIHFFRHHPNKYGNYVRPWEIPPLLDGDVELHGGQHSEALDRARARQRGTQKRWLAHRAAHRLARKLTNASPDKPLSRVFAPMDAVAALIERFRERRSAFFLREYPLAEGDPRVFWWRLLHRFAPERGEILNIGALPTERRDENTAFVKESVRVTEMDIDAGRQPHIVASISDPPAELHRRFAATLLFGLPYIDAPGRAIDHCRGLVIEGGIGLFGFPDETHPMRGAMWNRSTRPLWRRDLEPLTDIGLKGNLWSFDRAGLEDLFRRWELVEIENFSHYWFVVCRSRP